MNYEISGTMRLGNRREKFTRQLAAKNEDEAKEKILSLYGSAHGTPRRFITIEKIGKATEKK